MQENPKTPVLVTGEEKSVAATAATTEPAKYQPTPFRVESRSRAERIAKVLYGPLARVWVNRTITVTLPATRIGPGEYTETQQVIHNGVQIGVESGSKKTVLTEGEDFSSALRLPVETYVKGAGSYAATKMRLNRIALDAWVSEFAEPALSQFPEFEADKKKPEKDQSMMLQRLLDMALGRQRTKPTGIPVIAPPMLEAKAVIQEQGL